MKRTERHHLKENEVAEWVLQLKDFYEGNRSAIVYGVSAVLIVAIGALGYLAWRQNGETQSRTLLAAAMAVADAPVTAPTAPEAGKPAVQPPGTYPTERARAEAALPRLLASADAYPASDAGITARYEAAAALIRLGRIDEGVKQYQEVVNRGSGLYPLMARLGIAEADVLAGKYDAAIAGYQEVVTKYAEQAPIDGVLMDLGRAYRLAGKTADARKTFARVTEEFPQSPYATFARTEIETLGTARQ